MSKFEHEMRMYYLEEIDSIYKARKPEGEYILDLELAQSIYEDLEDLCWDAAYKGLSLYTEPVRQHMAIWKRLMNNMKA